MTISDYSVLPIFFAHLPDWKLDAILDDIDIEFEKHKGSVIISKQLWDIAEEVNSELLLRSLA